MRFFSKTNESPPFKPLTFTIHVDDWEDFKALCKWAIEDQPRVDVVRFLKDKMAYALRNSGNSDA